MELRNVRAFVAVAGERHFGRAAASLHLTQPALTLRIQSLERELGIQLLRRSAREVRLTPAGEALLERAEALIREEDRTLSDMKDYVGGVAGRLNISYLTLWDAGLPARIIAEFRQRYPAIKLEMTTGYSQPNVARLLAHEVDFTFVGVSIGQHDGVVMRPLDRHELVAVMAPTNELMGSTRLPVRSLRGKPMISTSGGVNTPLIDATISWLTEGMGAPPNIIREEPPDQMAAALAESGNAFALMTEHRAILAATQGLVYRRLTPSPIIEYGVAWLRENRSPSLANLVAIVDAVAPPLKADLPPDCELLRAGWRHRSTS